MALATKPSECQQCPAFEWGCGFVPPLVPKNETSIAIIGQGPGELEANYSEPFLPTAPAGEKLTSWLYAAELQRTKVLITNIVWCWLPQSKPKGFPKGNRMPTSEEMEFCYRTHLEPLLRQLGFDQPSKWVFTIGSPASRFFLQEEKVEKYLGTVNLKELPSGT